MGDKGQLAPVAAAVGDSQLEMLVDFMGRQELEPLDQAHAVAIEILAQIEAIEFFLLADPVKIDVVHRQAPAVFVDQGKRRAAHPGVGGHVDAPRKTADKAGLAGAELTDQANDLAALN